MNRLPAHVIVNANGLYRTGSGAWSPYRQEAISFDDTVSAQGWIRECKLTDAKVSEQPYDEAKVRSEQRLETPIDTAQHRRDYDPYEAA